MISKVSSNSCSAKHHWTPHRTQEDLNRIVTKRVPSSKLNLPEELSEGFPVGYQRMFLVSLQKSFDPPLDIWRHQSTKSVSFLPIKLSCLLCACVGLVGTQCARVTHIPPQLHPHASILPSRTRPPQGCASATSRLGAGP